MRLSKTVQQLRLQEEEIHSVIGEMLRMEEVLQARAGEGMTASEYVLYKSYEEDRARDLDLKQEAKKKILKEIEVEQKNLVQLTKERKMFERLKERQWKRFQNQTEKLEQKNNDEMVITRYRSVYTISSDDVQGVSENVSPKLRA